MMLVRGLRGAAAALALTTTVSTLAGCAAAPPDRSGLQVVAGFYPLAWVAERVAGDGAEVVNLTSPGGEPHDLELGFRESVDVARADLVVYERGFQAAVDEAVDSVAEGATLDAAAVADLLPAQEGGGSDPHFWLDPLRLATVGDALGLALGEIDPAGATAYADRAAALRADLEALDAAYAAGLTGCARSTVVVSHDAFGYLARYGLRFESINGLSPDAEPTPADLARLQRLAREEGITTVFSETLATPKLAETLAGDLGIATGVLDPIEGLSDTTALENYLTLMRANLRALEEANGC